MKKVIITLFLIIAIVQPASANWTEVQSSPDIYISDIAIQNDTVYLASVGSGVYRSVNNLESWDNLRNGLDSIQSRSTYQLLVDGPNLLIATEDGIYKSTNNGQNWFRSSDGIFVGNGAWYAFTESIESIGNDLFTGAYTGIYRSTDGGSHWLATNITGDHVGAKAFTMHNGILFGARESINTPYAYKSTNGGLNWQNYNTLNMPTITYLSEPPLLWCGTIAGVWLSTNDGASWQSRSNGLSADPYNSSIIRLNGNLISSVKFGGSGIYLSRNDGVLWEDFGQGLPFLSSIEELVVFDDKILAATSDGLYQRYISEVPTGIDSEFGNLPHALNLLQNYPNPFNPSTVIEYSLESPAHVNLAVFDILGNRVATLVDENRQSGSYRVTFDGSALSGGIYFYRLLAGKYNLTQKAILLK